MISGERIRQARELLAMTQTDLAESLQVSQPAVAQMESGLIQPAQNVLEAVCFATGFPVPFFLQAAPPEFPLGSLLYRARSSVTAREKSQTARHGQLLIELLLRLTAIVRLPLVRIPQLKDTRPSEAAEIARDAMGVAAHSPIPHLVRLLERNGCTVLALSESLDLPRLDAFSAWASIGEPRPTMTLLYRDHPGRWRFNVAHELGHLVMHSPPRGTVADMEREADEFASSFLLPADGVLSDVELPVTLTGLMQLRERWGVSVQALIHRCRDSGLITERQSSDLYRQASARGWKMQDPGTSKPEKPRALVKMLEMAFGTINVEKPTAEQMNWPRALVKRLLAAYEQVPAMGEEEHPKSHTDNVVSFRAKRQPEPSGNE